MADDVKKNEKIKEKVRLIDVAKEYANVTAVNEISLIVNQGEFFTLLGASGCGKTTTLLMIAGFEKPTSGTIWLDGKDVTKIEPQKRNIGMVFQSYALFPHMSIYSNIAFPLKARKIGRKEIDRRVEDALKLVQLEEYGNRRPSQLSGGQQQRVALGRALVYQPTLLLMDEPLGSLDKQLRTDMQREIRQLKQRTGATVIYVTHDQEEALSMSDKIGVMAEGRLCQVGSPDELFDYPNSRLVAKTLGEVSVIPVLVMEDRSKDATVKIKVGPDTLINVPCALKTAPVDTSAWLCIRPKYIKITTPHDGFLTGIVTQTAYLGGECRVYIKLCDKLTEVKAIIDDISAAPRVGDRIGLRFNTEKSALVYD